MNPGELDRRILIEKPTYAQQTNNEMLATWASYGYRWAKVEHLGADEVLLDEALEFRYRARFTMRFERINETYRIKYDNKVYNIAGITPIEGRENYMALDCESSSITNFRT